MDINIVNKFTLRKWKLYKKKTYIYIIYLFISLFLYLFIAIQAEGPRTNKWLVINNRLKITNM